MSSPNPITPLATPAVGSLTGALVETYLKPHLQKSARRSNKQKALDELTFFGGFQKYLDRALERHAQLTTLAMQGKPRLLSELYMPLTLVAQRRSNVESEVIRLDCYPDALLPQLRRVLLTDDAGMGKSTLVKFLFVECARVKAGLPILIELRRLRDGKGIPDVLVDELCEICTEIAREAVVDAVAELLTVGEFVFFLDGYDEVPFDERERVALHLREFVGRAGHNKRNTFLVSSRPDSGVSSLPGFHGFHIQPLKVEEAFSLLRKYDSNGELSNQLIAELREQLSSVEEFLTNPMLVSLLFEAYDYTRSIPLKKAAFYRQVYDALFERHDATKPLFKREKYSKLDKDDFERVLRALSICTLKGGVGYSKDEILLHIAKARRMCPGLTFSESDFLQDLLSTVPLFAREGDYHRWKHKSLQEYFAARYICGDIGKDEQAKVLRQMVNGFNHQNVLSLCYDLDYRTFRNTVIYDLTSDFLHFYETSYIGIDRELIPEEHIHERKIVCYGYQAVFLSKKMNDVVGKYGSEVMDIDHLVEGRKVADLLGIDPQFSIFWDYLGDYLSMASVYVPLIHLLDSKENSITIRKKKVYPEERTAIEKEFLGNVESGVLLVADDPSLPCNSTDLFVKTTETIEFHSVLLNIHVCRALQAEIEADLERENSDSVLSLL